MNKKGNIILGGSLGVEKTLIGSSLARSLQWRFVEVDRVIEARAGLSVPDIFSLYGEAYFASLEKETCRSLAHVNKLVVSTGERTVLDPESLELLSPDGLVIWLQDSSAPHVPERACQVLARTHLMQDKCSKTINEQLTELELARVGSGSQVDIAGLSIEQVVNRIFETAQNGVKGQVAREMGHQHSDVSSNGFKAPELTVCSCVRH
jgi:shikimate kinase